MVSHRGVNNTDLLTFKCYLKKTLKYEDSLMK